MIDKVFAKPTSAGLKVPLPAEARINGRRHFEPAGEMVADGTFVRGLERQGDLFVASSEAEVVKLEQAAKAAKSKSEAPRASSKAGE